MDGQNKTEAVEIKMEVTTMERIDTVQIVIETNIDKQVPIHRHRHTETWIWLFSIL